MKKFVEISGQQFEYNTEWNGEIISNLLISIDSETELISEDDPSHIPTLSLVTVSCGKDNNYIIHPTKLAKFFELHSDKQFIYQNIAFDYHVFLNHFIVNKHNKAKEILLAQVNNNKVHDTMILDSLYNLGVNDAYPRSRNLALLAKIYANLTIDKKDEYRLRYSELIGLDSFDQVEPGFLDYAIKDAIVTYEVFIKLYDRAKKIAKKAGIRKETVEKYGLLTEAIQIKGALALSQITRNGICIDLHLAEATFKKLKEEITEVTKDLLSHIEYKDIFKFNKKTGLMEFTKHNNPKLSLINLRKVLEQVAKEIEQDTNLPVKIPKTEKGFIATSIKDWADYTNKHPFLLMYHNLVEYTKLAQFFKALQVPKIHPRYNILVRTGRTSCYSPNIQNQPKKAGIRDIFEASEGYFLLVVDYKFIELRTLAAVLESMYEKSVMANAIRQNKDLHCLCGAIFNNLTYEEFLAKEQTDKQFYEEWRQNSKICFSGDTEILTEKGWCEFKDYDGITPVAQYVLPDGITAFNNSKWDGSNGTVSFTKPLDFRKFDKETVGYQQDRNTDLLMTPNHNVLFLTNKYVRQLPAINCREPRYLIAGGKYHNKPKLTEIETRLLAMFIAEASYKGSSGIRLGFTKKRKIDRCRELLTKGDIEFSENINKDGITNFYIPKNSYIRELSLQYFNEDKDLYWITIHNIDGEIYLDEAKHWDGNHIKGTSRKRILLGSINKQTLDIMQAIAALNNCTSTLTYSCKTSNNNDFYNISYRQGNIPKHRVSWNYAIQPDKIPVYCVQVPSGYIIVRRNGKVTVMPNCNFGLAGGLGANSLVYYAKAVYGVDLSLEGAQTFRNKWINDVFPEMKEYLFEDTMALLAQNLQTSVSRCWKVLDLRGQKCTVATCIPIKNIVSGKPFKKDGTPYNPLFIDKVWENLCQLNNNNNLTTRLRNREASEELGKDLFWSKVSTLTGRIRGRVSFTQNKNFPFQGLAADGIKLALWELSKKNYKIIGMIHDEAVFEIKDHGGYADREEIQDIVHIMESSMQQITGKIPIECDYILHKKWKKKGKVKIEGNKVYPV